MQSASWKYLAVFLIIVVFGNIVGLWISQVLQQRQFTHLNNEIARLEKGIKTLTSTPIQTQTAISSSSTTAKPQSSSTPLEHDQNYDSRITALAREIEDLKTQQETSESNTSSGSSIKEYFVYLGSGNSSSTEWTDLPGAIVTIDSSHYQHTRSIHFEAGLAISSGNAYARLINKDSGSVIWGSEVMHNTSMPTWKTSSGFSLQSGQATYMVQLRSSSGEYINMSGARIKILVE